jgi:hypothetical protein
MRRIYILWISLLLSSLGFAQTEEKSIDFTVSPGVLQDGKIQVAFGWITPNDFRKTELSLTDVPKISDLHPNNNQMIVSKIAFISKKSSYGGGRLLSAILRYNC